MTGVLGAPTLSLGAAHCPPAGLGPHTLPGLSCPVRREEEA